MLTILIELIIKEFDEDFSKLKFEGEYLNGKRNGKGKEYYQNGTLRFEGEYLDNHRIKGKYYNNGIMEYEGEYLYDKNENYGNFIGAVIESLKKNLKYEKRYYNNDIYFFSKFLFISFNIFNLVNIFSLLFLSSSACFINSLFSFFNDFIFISISLLCSFNIFIFFSYLDIISLIFFSISLESFIL